MLRALIFMITEYSVLIFDFFFVEEYFGTTVFFLPSSTDLFSKENMKTKQKQNKTKKKKVKLD